MTTLLRGAGVIDGVGGFHPATDVLVDGDRIAALGPAAVAGRPPPDRTVDLAGGTLLPGLIDCHVHLCKGNAVGESNRWREPGAVPTEREAGTDAAIPGVARDVLAGACFARRTLAAGYTTVRDVGGAVQAGDVAVREAIRLGFTDGPRVLASAGGIVMSGGHGWDMGGFVEVDGPDSVRRAARRQLKAGADVIKLMAGRAGGTATAQGGPELTVAEMRAACEEAHNQECRVAAHAVAPQAIRNAIEAGVDTIEHGCLADDRCLDLMAERGVYLICTLFPYVAQAEISLQAGYSADVAEPSRRLMERYPQVVRDALDRGVPVALGSDCGIRDLTPHGDNAAELEMIVRHAGVTPMRAIELSTACGAHALGLDSRVGSIESGKCADLIAVAGDPRGDVTLLRPPNAPVLVMRAGRIVGDAGGRIAAGGEAGAS